MAAAIGADVEQLRSLAKQFTQGADRLEQASSGLGRVIGAAAYWRGNDADQFRTRWRSQSTPSITAAVKTLRTAAEALAHNADEQDQASAAGGGGTVPQASKSSKSDKPLGTKDLFKRIHNEIYNDPDAQDGVRIVKVTSDDGTTRLIVYFKGMNTNHTDGRGFWRSLGTAIGFNAVDKKVTNRIDAILKNLPDGEKTEIMLVGYSEGGMDAQNLAAAHKYNVTTLVTYAAPLIKPDDPKIQTVHLEAEGDKIPGAGGAVAAIADGQAIHSPNIFKADVSADEKHSPGSYQDVATEFDKSTDPKFSSVKASIARFDGDAEIIKPTDCH
ncbi:WXG100 family type VII secretion target [Mycolicibacter kumamotonensis]|uniref:WXG100 family type VII secretion target n=1 Tax=Mycolicibacter kumamotonensis TaxID=354243 RepID=A0A7K3LF00_9MYCO|nr:WXG100 family type VII secretion target [Mycolicibacter kumamotonensis]NDJ90928.1 WXG100 family type VII secretion target [Mycolicibacter kumamotonensis]